MVQHARGAGRHRPARCQKGHETIERASYLIVDQSPLLQKGVDAHDCAHVTSQVPATGCHSQVFDGVEAICVDHKIAVVLVNSRRLASISVVEELRHGLALDIVDGVHVEPSAVAWENDRVGLRHKMLASSRLNNFL